MHRMMPADQRLQSVLPPGGKIELRLVNKLELATVERETQLAHGPRAVVAEDLAIGEAGEGVVFFAIGSLHVPLPVQNQGEGRVQGNARAKQEQRERGEEPAHVAGGDQRRRDDSSAEGQQPAPVPMLLERPQSRHGRTAILPATAQCGRRWVNNAVS